MLQTHDRTWSDFAPYTVYQGLRSVTKIRVEMVVYA